MHSRSDQLHPLFENISAMLRNLRLECILLHKKQGLPFSKELHLEMHQNRKGTAFVGRGSLNLPVQKNPLMSLRVTILQQNTLVLHEP